MTLILSGTDGLSDIDGSAATPAIRGTDTNTGIFFPAADTIAFSEGGVEAMRIDSSGNVGIGTSSPGTRLQIGNPSDSNQSLRFDFADSSTARINSTRLGAGNLQSLLLAGQDTLQFQTVGTERARIDSNGNFLVGTTGRAFNSNSNGTSFSSNGGQWLSGVTQVAGANMYLNQWNAAGTTQCAYFLYNGAIVGNISLTASSTAYVSSSDYRLKENIQPMTGALAKVALLKPVTYKWKVDGSDGEGFIAHELAEVCPSAVSGEKDAVDADGNPKYQGIDTSFLVATLTAAIQEQQAIIQSLTARIEALEGK